MKKILLNVLAGFLTINPEDCIDAVVALNVVNELAPLAVTESKLGDETTLIVGFDAVPPVVIFEPGPTL